MSLEELAHAAPVLIPGHGQRLVVFGSLDEPVFLWRPGPVEQGTRHLRFDVGVASAVDQQQRPRRQLAHRRLKRGEMAAMLALNALQRRGGDPAEEPYR